MKTLRIKNILLLLILVLFASRCATVSKTGMLEYNVSNKDFAVDRAKFALIVDKGGEINNITDVASKNYPNIFLNDYTSLPIWVNLDCRYESKESDPAFGLLAAFTLFTVPTPWVETNNKCNGRLLIDSVDGPIVDKSIYYSFEKTVWSPWIWFFVAPLVHNSEKFDDTNTIIEYAVQSLKEIDKNKLTEMYEFRKNRLKKVNIYGQSYWTFIGFDRSSKAKKKSNMKYDLVKIFFWKNYPDLLENPIESVVAAVYENGNWQPVMSIPRKLGLKSLTMVSVKIEGNKPLDIEIRENVKPKVEYFTYLSDYYDPEEVRWSNDMLIEAKNTTFAEELPYQDKRYLVQLQTQLEKEVLRLNENISKMELTLQQKLVKNENVSSENTLIPLYQQRISIFEALLTSVKQVLKYR
jgi:hypothetical protein